MTGVQTCALPICFPVTIRDGGMSTIIDFEAVVSNSASTASGVEEPLGSLAGRGYNGQKKGGKIEIKVNEWVCENCGACKKAMMCYDPEGYDNFLDGGRSETLNGLNCFGEYAMGVG